MWVHAYATLMVYVSNCCCLRLIAIMLTHHDQCRSSELWVRQFLYSHSLDIPTSRHFCSRQYWQRLRVTLLMMQFFSRWQVYTMFFWMLLRKKPCVSQRQMRACSCGGIADKRLHIKMDLSSQIKQHYSETQLQGLLFYVLCQHMVIINMIVFCKRSQALNIQVWKNLR